MDQCQCLGMRWKSRMSNSYRVAGAAGTSPLNPGLGAINDKAKKENALENRSKRHSQHPPPSFTPSGAFRGISPSGLKGYDNHHYQEEQSPHQQFKSQIVTLSELQWRLLRGGGPKSLPYGPPRSKMSTSQACMHLPTADITDFPYHSEAGGKHVFRQPYGRQEMALLIGDRGGWTPLMAPLYELKGI